MKRILPLLIALLLLLSGCDNAAFNSDGLSLSLSRTYSDGALLSSYLHLVTHLDREEEYSLILRSPSSSLEWSASLSSSGDGFYSSPEMAITQGALFPQGEYTWFIMSSSGKELTGSISLSYDVEPSLPSADTLSEGDTITWYDEAGEEVSSASSASSALISSHDSYGNPLLVRVTI